MPVIEYMFTINERGRLEVPGFVADRGYHQSPIDKSFLGWLNEDREYWVPDTIVTKTKEECVARALAIHAVQPYHGFDENAMPSETPMTEAEVTTMMENWYDWIVANNT